MITDNVKKSISPAEAFVLLYATYLHDIGKLEQEENHEKLSYNKIRKNYRQYLLENEFEAETVAEVAYAHADEKEKPLDSLDRRFGVDSLSSSTLDLRFLGALLRLADEIDNAFTKVNCITSQKLSLGIF